MREVIIRIWVYFLHLCGLSWWVPLSLKMIMEAWLGVPFLGCGRLLGFVPFATIWLIWKEGYQNFQWNRSNFRTYEEGN